MNKLYHFKKKKNQLVGKKRKIKKKKLIFQMQKMLILKTENSWVNNNVPGRIRLGRSCKF